MESVSSEGRVEGIVRESSMGVGSSWFGFGSSGRDDSSEKLGVSEA